MNVPLEQLTPEQRIHVEAGLRAYLLEHTRSEVIHGRPLDAALACRSVRRQAAALVAPAAELAATYHRADLLVDRCLATCDDEGARAVNDILTFTETHGLVSLVVGLLTEVYPDPPTVQYLEQLRGPGIRSRGLVAWFPSRWPNGPILTCTLGPGP